MSVHELTTAVSGVTFFFWKMHVREELGRPFQIDLEMFCEKADVEAEKMLGTSVTLKITKPGGTGDRFFNGLVSRFAFAGERGRYQVYRVTLRPWLWFLTRTSDCRIFQQMKVPDIIEKVFRDKNGFTDFKRSLSGTYRTWDYCVQYRESDFAFVSRLMEQEGIYYFFEHVDGKHTLVLADAPSAHSLIAGTGELPYRGGGDGRIGQDHIHDWLRYQEVQTATCIVQDYDFTKPKANLEVRSQVTRQHALASYEAYDYPGEYAETADGTSYVKARIEELQSEHLRGTGIGVSYDAAVGKKFKLVDFPRGSENGEYLIVSGDYQIESGEVEQFSADSQNRFDVKLETIGATQSFRARRTTPKPIVAGPQTAVVVGKSGEEIWTDNYGRVKVQFFWDREGKKDENSSCWIRVSQVWAGKTWGAMHIPRIGQEVIVEFLEGDPDRPIITGRVYNNDEMPPYALPDNATQSGIKSRSLKEGTAENFNELRFEDKKGEEEVYFHAEKNFNRVVENDDTLKVGFIKKDKGDQTVEIHNNQKTVIGNSESADGSQTIEVWKNRTETVKEGDETVTISKGNRLVTVSKGNDTHKVETGNREVTIKNNDTLTVTTGNREATISTGNDTLTVSTGNLTIKVAAGKVEMEAAVSIELKCGVSSIKIEPAKITLKAAEIAVTGDAKVAVAAAMVDVAGSGMVKIAGGIVKIN